MLKTICPVCFEEYSESVIPLVLPKCGHTFCKECIRQSLKIGKKTQKSITCFVCKTINTSEKSSNSVDQCFPRNYGIIQYMNEISETDVKICNCNSHISEKKYICMDDRCYQKGKFCTDCLRKYHSQCREGYTFKAKQFDQIVDFGPYLEMKNKFDVIQIKNKIECKIAALKSDLFGLIDNALKISNEHFTSAKNSDDPIEFYFDQKNQIRPRFCTETRKMILEWKDEAKYRHFVDFINVKLLEDIEIGFDRIKKTFVLESSGPLSQFWPKMKYEHQFVLEKLKKSDHELFDKLFLQDAKVDFSSSIVNIFEQLSKQLRTFSPVFKIKRSKNFDPEKVVFMENVIKNAFLETPFKYDLISNAISSKFSTQYPDLITYVHFGSVDNIKENTACPNYIVLEYKGLILSFKQQVKPDYNHKSTKKPENN